MENTHNPKSDWLRLGAALVAVFVTLPVLAVLLFFARFVAVGLVLALLAGALVLAACSARFRGWLLDLDAQEASYKGLRLAGDVALAPVHSWARRGRDGVAAVGTDDIAPTVLGPISSVELPAPGRWFRRGEPLARLRRGDRAVTVRAPVSGTVVERNEALHWRPELVNDTPYGDGWLVRMRSEAVEERGWLRRGQKARAWFRGEVDQLVALLLHQDEPCRAVADGGPLVRQLHRHIDDLTWQRLSATMFGGRVDAPRKE